MSQGPKGPDAPMTLPLTAAHRRRLRELWRSAGWPSHDMLEVELLAAGMVERMQHGDGRETLRVTDSGVQLLAATLHHNRSARSEHERLVERVAAQMQQAGRIVWRGLSLRAPLLEEDGRTRWAMAMPDVFSIRHTTLEDQVLPIVHEVKVRRADLLADVKRPTKREAYLALSSQCWYVLSAGIGDEHDVPLECGVMVAHEQHLEVLRPAPQRPLRMGLATWMALARAQAEPNLNDDAQSPL